MAPEEGRNVRNKLVTITLAVIFVIKTKKIFQNSVILTKINQQRRQDSTCCQTLSQRLSGNSIKMTYRERCRVIFKYCQPNTGPRITDYINTTDPKQD